MDELISKPKAAPIPYDQLVIGQEVWVITFCLYDIVEHGFIFMLETFENFTHYRLDTGLPAKILPGFLVFDNEETALLEAAALLEEIKNEITKRLIQIKNKEALNEKR